MYGSGATAWTSGAGAAAEHAGRCAAARQARGVRAAIAGALIVWAAASTACLPYPMGATAHPVPVGEARKSTSLYMIPNAVSLRALGDSARTAPPAGIEGVDLEYRTGIDSASDIAVRLPSLQGIVVDYKRRVSGPADTLAAAVAVQLGAGFVNLGQHAFGDAALIVSGADVNGIVPYGGARIMGVVPLVQDAVSDQPTMGGFAGLRLTIGSVVVAPEIGVYHDPSALRIRRGSLLLVPSVTFSGDALRLFPRLGRRAPTPSTAGHPPEAFPSVPIARRPAGPSPAPGPEPRRPPEKPATAGPVGTPSGAIPPPRRATAGASRRRGRRLARP